MKIIQLYVWDVLQNALLLKNYFLRSSLCPFHCPSGSLPAAPWLTLCYSATSVAGAAARWYRRLFSQRWAAGLLGHSLASLALIYFYRIQSKCCGFILPRSRAKFNSSGRECWKRFWSIGRVFCQPRWQPRRSLCWYTAGSYCHAPIALSTLVLHASQSFYLFPFPTSVIDIRILNRNILRHRFFGTGIWHPYSQRTVTSFPKQLNPFSREAAEGRADPQKGLDIATLKLQAW